MNRDYFWLTEDQFARLEPLLPTDTRGKLRVDDRRVISGRHATAYCLAAPFPYCFISRMWRRDAREALVHRGAL
jgi:hypothetical protein